MINLVSGLTHRGKRLAKVAASLLALSITLPGVRAESIDRELLDAATRGDLESARHLIAEGANPGFRRVYTTTNELETTALKEAIKGRHIDVMRLLLGHNLDDRIVSEVIGWLRPATEGAARALDLEFVELLLEQGRFDLLAANAHRLWGEHALRRVLEHGPIDDPQVLIRTLDLGMSWDTVSLASQHLTNLDALWQKEGNPSQHPFRQSLPLVLARRVAHRLHDEARAAEFVREVENRGVDPEAWGANGSSAARAAKFHGLIELAAVFRDEAADDKNFCIDREILPERPPRTDWREWLPNSVFSYPRDTDGSAPRRITDDDRLASAWYHADPLAEKSYREAGARLRGSAAVGLAGSNHLETLGTRLVSEKAFGRIEESGIDLDDWQHPLDNPYRAAKDLETVRWLLDRGVPLRDDPKLLGWILFFGEEPDRGPGFVAKKDERLRMGEAIRERLRMAEALIEAGADINHRVGERDSSLLHHAATLFPPIDRKGAIRLLLKAGLDPELKDNHGKTAWQYAEELYRIDMLEILDPGRRAKFWSTYGAQGQDSVAGIWSNNRDGFNTFTLFLGENGGGLWSGGIGGAPVLWRIEGPQFMLDIVDRQLETPIPSTEIVAAFAMEHRKGNEELLLVKQDDEVISLKRTADAETANATLREYMDAMAQIPPIPEEDANDDFDQKKARRLGMEQISDDTGRISLLNWPDESLPPKFRSERLYSLKIQHGALRRLPDDFAARFPNLKTLIIQHVPLEECPPDLDQLASLQVLHLNGLQLETLPDIQLMALTTLNLEDNRLSQIPSGWFAGNKIYLANLSNNRFQEIPPVLKEQHQLEVLYLSANSITRLDLGSWPELRHLHLHENRISEIHPGAQNLERLTQLSMAGNCLSDLPHFMENWHTLDSLDLRHNDFDDLPQVLSNIKSLQSVRMSSNRMTREWQNKLAAEKHHFELSFNEQNAYRPIPIR